MSRLFLISLLFFLSACGGGSPSSSISSFSNPQIMYGSGWASECQTVSIQAASNNPQGAEILNQPGTGFSYDPETDGTYTPYCSSKMTFLISPADFHNRGFPTIVNEIPAGIGAVIHIARWCASIKSNVHYNTWVKGDGPFPPDFINLPTATFDALTEDGIAEVGDPAYIESGGILLASSDGHPHQGQAIYEASCSDASPVFGVDPWSQWTVDTIDRFGTAVTPVINSCEYESRWQGMACFTHAKYVGKIHIFNLSLDVDTKGNLVTYQDGNYHGSGYHYWATRTDRQLPTTRGAPMPIPWSN